MGAGSPTIERILFHQPGPAGDVDLALMSDRTLRILHNGQIHDGQRWHPDDAEDAVRAYLAFKIKLAEKSGR